MTGPAPGPAEGPAPGRTTDPAAAPAGYRALPRLAGRSFMPVAFLARLPFSMTVLGLLVLVSTATGSVADGGLATAAASVGTALLASVQGRLADRLGQRPVLLVATTLNTSALVAVVVGAAQGWPTPVLLAVSFVIGGTAPQVAAFARVRWLHLTRARPVGMRAAMSYESTADEVTFVLGPALVGALGAGGDPGVALLVAAGLVGVFGTALALHPTAPPTATGSRRRAPSVPRLLAQAWAPVAGMACMGLFFGGMQASVTDLATRTDRPGLAGLLYAVLGVGSAVTALAVALLPDTVSLRSRWVVAAGGMTLAGAGTLVVSEVGSLVGVLAVTGLFVGPAMVTLFSVGGKVSAPADAGTTMTLLVSANVLGVALGAAVAGRLAETSGLQVLTLPSATPFGVPVLAAAALTVVGLAAHPGRSSSPGGGTGTDHGPRHQRRHP